VRRDVREARAWTAGRLDIRRDSALCAATGRTPLSTSELGLEVTLLTYSTYLSAEEGRRVAL